MAKNCLLTPKIHPYWVAENSDCVVLTPIPIEIYGIQKPWALIHVISGNRYFPPMDYKSLEQTMFRPDSMYQNDYGWEKTTLEDVFDDCIERSAEVRGFTFQHNDETIMQVHIDSYVYGLLSLERAQYIDTKKISPSQVFEWDIYRQHALMS